MATQKHDMPDHPAETVWAAYLAYHPRAILSPERRRLIERRLHEGWPVDVLVSAIRGNHLDPHCAGQNDRYRVYHSLGLILRDADHIERYADLAVVDKPVDVVENAWRVYQRWCSESGAIVALDMVAGTYSDDVVAAIRQRVLGDEVGKRRVG